MGFYSRCLATLEVSQTSLATLRVLVISVILGQNDCLMLHQPLSFSLPVDSIINLLQPIYLLNAWNDLCFLLNLSFFQVVDFFILKRHKYQPKIT
jgi:hypothetical protein